MKYVTKTNGAPAVKPSVAKKRGASPPRGEQMPRQARPSGAVKAAPVRRRAVQPGSAAAAAGGRDHAARRLLDAAERVFAEKGYTAANVREITADAGLNLAAVNYHFGSKEALYAAVFRRILNHLREHRIAAITEVVEEAAAKHDLELLLRVFCKAFLSPLMDSTRGRLMMELFLREMTSPNLPPGLILEQLIQPIQVTAASAMVRVCPGLSEIHAAMCLHSIVGQLTHILQIWRMKDGDQFDKPDEELISGAIAHIVEFSSAGVRAKAGGGSQDSRP